MIRRAMFVRILAGVTIGCAAAGARATDDLDDARAIGLGPETLAVAGVTGAEAAEFVGRVDAAEPLRVRLDQDRAALDAALAAVAEAREQLAHGARSTSDEDALRLAEAAVVDAQATLAQTRDLLFAAAIATLDQERAALVTRARANLARSVPAHYRVAELSADQWALLERACREARMREARVARGESPPALPTAYTQIIAEVEGQSAVQQAEARYAQYGEAVALAV